MSKSKSTTVQQLIELLQNNHEPDDSIVFQYLVADYTKFSEEEFTPIAEYLMDNEQFGSDTADVFGAWVTEANDVLKQEVK